MTIATMSSVNDRLAAIEQRLAALETFQNVVTSSFGAPAAPAALASTAKLAGIYVHFWSSNTTMNKNAQLWLMQECGLQNAKLAADEQMACIVFNIFFSPGGRADIGDWKKHRQSLSLQQKHYGIALVAGMAAIIIPQDFVDSASVVLDDDFTDVARLGSRAQANNKAKATISQWIASAAICTRIGCANKATLQCSGCKGGKYCSTVCGRQDWLAGHNQECGF